MIRQTASDEALRRAEQIDRIGEQALSRAQEESRRQGIPNVYSAGGVLFWELPDGTLSKTDPYVDPASSAKSS